jgi:hypothetical protein
MGAEAAKVRGRPAKERGDPTMRYIARKQLWDAIAIECGIRPKTVRAWRRVPWNRVLSVERAIGRPRRQIRSDIYPD